MRLATRLAIALAVGTAGLVALAWWVGAKDAAAAARLDRSRLAVSWPRAERLAVPLGPPVPSVWLATELLVLPPELAPVVAVDGLGGARLVRAAVPMPRDAGLPAGVVLPAGGLADLGPEARAMLLAVLGQLLAERPVRPAQVRPLGAVAAGADLDWLLGWLQ